MLTVFEKSEYDIERDARTKRTTILHVALGMVTTLQAVTMFFALRKMLPADGGESWVIPAMAAGVVGAAFWMVWHWLKGVAPLSTRTHSRTMYLCVAVVLTFIAIGTTSWFMATAISGNTAMRIHMNEYLGSVTKQLATVSANDADEYKLIATLGEIATGWKGAAEIEESGAYTGKAGKGPMAGKLRAAADNYYGLRDSVDANHEQFMKNKLHAAKLREEMTTVANSTGDQQQFLRLASQFNELIATMDAMTKLKELQSRGGFVDVKVNNAEITTKIDATTKRLRDEAKATEERRKPVDALLYQPLEPATAMMTYAGKVMGAWVMAVGFDTLPLIIFVMLMIAYADAHVSGHRPHAPFSVIPGNRDAA